VTDGGGGAHLVPRAESGGTAMNALAHCAEALYVAGRNATADEHALEGARLIGRSLPLVLSDGHDLGARKSLLEGGMHAGIALAMAGIGLADAMAQAIGGRYGIHHGAANALCLQPALRFNEAVVGAEISRFGDALRERPGRRLRGVCSPFRVWAAARSRRPRGWVARAGGTDCEPAGRTREPEAGLATADLRALPLHLVKGDRPVSRRRGVYIIDGSDDADVDGWKKCGHVQLPFSRRS
jgi:Iron-containing alcohol dehydrogenase